MVVNVFPNIFGIVTMVSTGPLGWGGGTYPTSGLLKNYVTKLGAAGHEAYRGYGRRGGLKISKIVLSIF